MAENAKKGALPDYVPYEEFRERMKDAEADAADAPVDEEHAGKVAAAVDAMLVG